MDQFLKPKTISNLTIASALLALVGVMAGAINQYNPAWSDVPLWPSLMMYSAVGIIIVAVAVPRGIPQRFLYLLIAAGVVLCTVIFWFDPYTNDNVFVLFFVFSGIVSLTLPPRWAFASVGVLYLVTLINAVAMLGPSGFLNLLSAGGGFLFFALFGAILRQANLIARQNKLLAEELQTTNTELVASRQQAAQLVIAEERNRLAREMHDSLGHRLTVAIVQLEGAQRLIPRSPEKAADMVGDMRMQLKEGLGELRQTLTALRGSAESDTPLEAAPLETSVYELVETFSRATGLSVSVEIPDELPIISPPARHALFRAVQEGLTNVQRHANATEAWVIFSAENNYLTATIADNGRGLPADLPEGRFGLRGLQERAEQFGGSFSFEPNEPTGTRLNFSIPV